MRGFYHMGDQCRSWSRTSSCVRHVASIRHGRKSASVHHTFTRKLYNAFESPRRHCNAQIRHALLHSSALCVGCAVSRSSPNPVALSIRKGMQTPMVMSCGRAASMVSGVVCYNRAAKRSIAKFYTTSSYAMTPTEHASSPRLP